MNNKYSFQCNLCNKKYLFLHHYEAHIQKVHQSRVKSVPKQNLQHLRKPQQYQPYHNLGTYPIATNNPNQQSISNVLQHQHYAMNQQTEIGSEYINHVGNLENNNIINLLNSNTQHNTTQNIYQPNSLIGTEKPPNIRSETNSSNSSNNQELIPKPQTNTSSNEINANPSQDLEKLNSLRYHLKKFINNFAHHLSQEHRAQIATFILLLKQNEENDDVILENFDNGYHFEYCLGYFTTSDDGIRKCHCTNFFVRKKEILKIIDLYQQSCSVINTT